MSFRKISQDAAEAFMRGDKFSRGNTKVQRDGVLVQLRLHGNLIAERSIHSTDVQVRLAGWNTRTTRGRVNAVAEYFNPSWGFSQRDFGVYFNEVEVDPDQWVMLWHSASTPQWGFEWRVQVPLAQMLESNK